MPARDIDRPPISALDLVSFREIATSDRAAFTVPLQELLWLVCLVLLAVSPLFMSPGASAVAGYVMGTTSFVIVLYWGLVFLLDGVRELIDAYNGIGRV